MAELLAPLEIAFMHPDLGIGGAERLVVDCALGLKSQGHSVTIYTSHCDMDHCFEEIKNGEIPVEVIGDFLPTNIGGRFAIVCATLRQLFLTFKLIRSKTIDNYDLFIVDQLSTSLPFIQAYKPRTLFYCHFPDQLLAKKGGLLKTVYRLPFNLIEQLSTGMADKIVVNSNFTKSVFQKTFRMLGEKLASVEVVYPCVDTDTRVNELMTSQDKKFFDTNFKSSVSDDTEFLLSVNRFERKKDIQLAIKSFQKAQESLGSARKSKLKLIVAGGYDPRVAENSEYLIELEHLCDKLELNFETFHYGDIVAKSRTNSAKFVLQNKIDELGVVFMTSISSSLKNLLITKSRLLLYTPSFEHFGIVPIESMNLGTPVLACNNGGPMETVEQDKTGWLAEPNVEDWTKHILVCLLTTTKSQMKEQCQKRVLKYFSRIAMTESLEDKIGKMMQVPKKKKSNAPMVAMALLNLLVFYILQFLFLEKDHFYVYGIMMIFNTVFLKDRQWGFYWLAFAGLVHFRS